MQLNGKEQMLMAQNAHPWSEITNTLQLTEHPDKHCDCRGMARDDVNDRKHVLFSTPAHGWPQTQTTIKQSHPVCAKGGAFSNAE